jgi:hypothetical protein
LGKRQSPDELVARRMIARRGRAQNELVAQTTCDLDLRGDKDWATKA